MILNKNREITRNKEKRDGTNYLEYLLCAGHCLCLISVCAQLNEVSLLLLIMQTKMIERDCLKGSHQKELKSRFHSIRLKKKSEPLSLNDASMIFFLFFFLFFLFLYLFSFFFFSFFFYFFFYKQGRQLGWSQLKSFGRESHLFGDEM